MWKIKTNASLIFRKFTNRLKYNISRTSADAGLRKIIEYDFKCLPSKSLFHMS